MSAIASRMTSLTVYSVADQKTSIRVSDRCEENSPGAGDFPAQRTSNAENVSIWWRHHEKIGQCLCKYNSDDNIFDNVFNIITRDSHMFELVVSFDNYHLYKLYIIGHAWIQANRVTFSWYRSRTTRKLGVIWIKIFPFTVTETSIINVLIHIYRKSILLLKRATGVNWSQRNVINAAINLWHGYLFLQNTHKSHYIGSPWGQVMG